MAATELIHAHQLLPSISSFDYQGNTLDLTLHAGEVVSLIGPDYSGKSDWLRTLAGVQSPRAGELSLLGQPVDKLDKAGWQSVRRQLAYVKSDNAVLSAANALQNVMLPASYHRIGNSRQIRSESTRLLAELGLFDLVSLPASLRKDQRFRIAVARALILQPAALIMDNPFMMLDAIATETFQHYLLRRVREQNMALIVLTHDINFAIAHSNRIVFITADEIMLFDAQHRMQDCNHSVVQNFLNKHRVKC